MSELRGRLDPLGVVLDVLEGLDAIELLLVVVLVLVVMAGIGAMVRMILERRWRSE